MQYPAQVQATIDLLQAINDADGPADATAGFFFRRRRYIGSKDRKVISEFTYKILRHQDQLDWWAERIHLKQDKSRTQVVLGLLFFDQMKIGDCERIFTGRKYQPSVLSHEEKNSLSSLESTSIEHPEMPDYIRYSIPQWSYENLCQVFSKDSAKQFTALNAPAPLDLRVNSLKSDRQKILAEFERLKWPAEASKWSAIGIRLERGKPLSQTKLFKEGYVEVQDEGSQIASLLVDAQPGHAVLDICAGAGGKSLGLAASMENKGRLYVTDLNVFRLSKAKERLRRAGVSNHEVRLLDRDGQQWLGRQKGRFDRVLADVPCSGSGTWRRNPDLKWRFGEKDIKELQTRQQEILNQAAPLVKPGGRLIYVTCSLYEQEDEQQVQAFLKQHQDFALMPCEDVWKDKFDVAYPGESETLKLTPFSHGTDGFFIAVFERRDSVQ